MKILNFLILLMFSSLVYAQEIDTLSFYSKAFGEERSVFVHTPDIYKYKSESLKLPIIYLLDGQHEWFVEPLLSDIEYLQYTHEIPHAIVVVIPHKNRYTECRITDLVTELPLDIFITEELDAELEKYNPSEFKLIIGHSFSASFSLYSYYKHPEYYAGVIAHTPLDKMDMLIDNFQQDSSIDPTKISISVGGIGMSKDYYHRTKYNQLKEQYPQFFNSIDVFEANYSAHNAVPLVSTPTLLSNIFENFSDRYTKIAQVNDQYKLINVPETSAQELEKIVLASKIGSSFYPPEIAELNGIASRFWNNDYLELAAEVYTLGTQYYPDYFEFYLSLYELTLDKDPIQSKTYLEKAELLLTTVEDNWEGKEEIIEEIKAEKAKNGW